MALPCAIVEQILPPTPLVTVAIQLAVTEQHIVLAKKIGKAGVVGFPDNRHYCPLALATRDVLAALFVSCINVGSVINFHCQYLGQKCCGQISLPDAAHVFETDFDNGRPVQPCIFNVDARIYGV